MRKLLSISLVLTALMFFSCDKLKDLEDNITTTELIGSTWSRTVAHTDNEVVFDEVGIAVFISESKVTHSSVDVKADGTVIDADVANATYVLQENNMVVTHIEDGETKTINGVFNGNELTITYTDDDDGELKTEIYTKVTDATKLAELVKIAADGLAYEAPDGTSR